MEKIRKSTEDEDFKKITKKLGGLSLKRLLEKKR